MLLPVLVCLAIVELSSCSCQDASFITLPIQDVHLSNGEVMRGTPITIGTPPLNLSMMPFPYFNDTWVYNSSASFCDWSTSSGCLTYRGGLYDPSSSSTSSKEQSLGAAGGDPRDVEDRMGQYSPDSAFVTDSLGVGNLTLSEFPIGIAGSSLFTAYNTQNSFGMGANSTILNALVAAGKIASRSYSWWWGLTGATAPVQMDGQMIFGGYDAAKIKGKKYTQPLSRPSKACHSSVSVTITDITLGFPNGTSASLTSPNAIVACVLPHYPLIVTLPWIPFFDNFEASTDTKNIGRGGSDGFTFGGMLYPPDEVFQGDMTITLSSGFQITFPNELMVMAPQVVRADGSLKRNQSVAEVLIDATEGTDIQNWAILGRHFFQAAYLTVDYDENTYTLSEASATANSDIVAVGGSCSDPHGSASTGDATNPNSSPKVNSNTSNKHDPLSTGAIVGAAVGSAFGVAVLVAAAVLLYKRKKRNHKNDDNAETLRTQRHSQRGEGGGQISNRHSFKGGPWFSEAMSSQVEEMGVEQDPLELAGRERPAELQGVAPNKARRGPFVAANRSPVELG